MPNIRQRRQNSLERVFEFHACTLGNNKPSVGNWRSNRLREGPMRRRLSPPGLLTCEFAAAKMDHFVFQIDLVGCRLAISVCAPPVSQSIS